jgi:hypothetical protein
MSEVRKQINEKLTEDVRSGVWNSGIQKIKVLKF